MKNENYVKGIIFGVIALFLVSLQPIVVILRPSVLDVYFFATMTCVVEAIILFPLLLIERQKIKGKIENQPSKRDEMASLLNGWKKNKKFIFYIGINFGIAQVLFFLAIANAGAINGSLAQQTTIVFGLLFGFLINHEKISKIQILFSSILFLALIYAVTQGSFNLIELNIGVLIMLVTVIIWMFAHSQSKRVFDKNEITPIQLVFFRNVISALFLFSTYFLFFPLENINLLFDPINIFFFILMGLLYGLDVLFWYKTLEHVDISKAAVIVSPMPILTAFFAFLILGEIFTIYHLIGTIVIIISISIIVREKIE